MLTIGNIVFFGTLTSSYSILTNTEMEILWTKKELIGDTMTCTTNKTILSSNIRKSSHLSLSWKQQFIEIAKLMEQKNLMLKNQDSREHDNTLSANKHIPTTLGSNSILPMLLRLFEPLVMCRIIEERFKREYLLWVRPNYQWQMIIDGIYEFVLEKTQAQKVPFILPITWATTISTSFM